MEIKINLTAFQALDFMELLEAARGKALHSPQDNALYDFISARSAEQGHAFNEQQDRWHSEYGVLFIRAMPQTCKPRLCCPPHHYHDRPARQLQDRRETLLALPRDWNDDERAELRALEAELQRRGVLSIDIAF